MTRSALRLLTILGLLCMAVSALLLWWQVQKQQERVMQLRDNLIARQAEFANLTFLVAAQDKLDTLTMDERRSTQLDVLKYLGLEKINLDFRIDGRESRSVGDTALIVRTVTVQARKPYQEVMTLIDQLFESGKFNIVNLNIQRGDEGKPEDTALLLQGRLFSLQKQGEFDAAPTHAKEPGQ
jgi:hypothetical protein